MPAPTIFPLWKWVNGYPKDHPIQDAAELVQTTDPALLADSVVEFTRNQLCAVVAAQNTRPAITGAKELFDALLFKELSISSGHLWTVFVLTADKKVKTSSRKDMPGTWPLKRAYAVVPTAEQLPDVPAGGSYLLVARATSRVLVDHPGIIPALNALIADTRATKGAAFSDIAFWHRPPSGYPSLYSARGRSGESNGQRLDFPEATNICL